MAQQLKRDLADAGLLDPSKAGDQGLRFAAKRRLVEGRPRQSVIAVRAAILDSR
jgi:hypothetical protein